jgi:LemA protein
MILYIIIAVLVLLVIFIWATYNSLVTLKVRVDEAWSDITVQLKRRTDLIPNLVNTVKGYATHESSVFEQVTNARTAMQQASSIKDVAAASSQIDGALKSLFAVAEAYPDLKANQNFIQLQQELVDTEDKIQGSRRFYNGGVRDLNTKIHLFPSNIFVNALGFKDREFFELTDEEQKDAEKPVNVQF